MRITEEEIQRMLATAEEYFQQIEGFSKQDTAIGTNILGTILLLLWLNELPIYNPKFPVVLRVAANVIEQIIELRKRGDE